MSEKLKIWLDMDNSPHVPFLSPIIVELQKRGHSVTITARDCFQTCRLLDLSGMEYVKIGRHYGRNLVLKAAGLVIRALQLCIFARKRKFELAVSHGSRSLMLACYILKIPLVNMFDYEYSKFGLLANSPRKQLIPAMLPDDILSEQLNLEKVVKYPGLKEEVYVKDLRFDDSLLKDLNIDPSKVIATIRPPASQAHYHNPESDTLFEAVVKFLLQNPDVVLMIFPRTDKQRLRCLELTKGEHAGRVIIPSKVFNGLDLIWHSDLVISGGGTMNREAAVMGVPAYSIFKAETPAIDKFLEKDGRLVFIKNPDDVKKIKIEKKPACSLPKFNRDNLLSFLVNEILITANA